MKLSCFAAAGVAAITLPAAAQESVDLTLHWIEVATGTNTPVAASNGTLEPGESARIVITATIVPGIGSPASYPAPPGPGSGTGTIAGLGLMQVDLFAGTQQLPSSSGAGSWTSIARAPGFALGGAGSVSHQGAYVHYLEAGQFVPPGGTANSSNPIANLWRGVWTPAAYSDRSVTWNLAAVLAGTPAVSILIQYGNDPSGYPLYTGKYVGGIYGSATIPIIPAPLTVLVLTPLLARRRRHVSS